MIRLRLVAVLLAAAAAPAFAQSGALDARVDRVERELRAVQRKVFPSGAPAFSEPEIGAAATSVAPPPEAGASGLNALTGRVDSVERELERVTGQIEQLQHRLDLLSEQSAKDRGEFDGRIRALEGPPAPAAAPGASITAPAANDGASPPSHATSRTGSRGAALRPAPRPAPAPESGVEADAAVQAAPAVTVAASGDPAEDAYMAGYDLWAAKKYPEAEAALKKVVAKYPKHRRASYAQNLLGRAYLDEGQPASAAEAFAANYQGNPRGERAPESLYYLGQSLIQLKKPADACRVYDELDSAYGATVSTTLKTRAAAARRDAKCK